MAYIISDDCISCGNCAENCPTEAIYEGDGKYEIDPDKCVDCGTCADACPVEAAKAAIIAGEYVVPTTVEECPTFTLAE